MKWSILLLLPVAFSAAAEVPKRRSPDHIRGRELYERSCWQCHGRTAQGDGPTAANLTVDVPGLRGVVTDDRVEELLNTIMSGSGLMPSYRETFDRRDARRILTFIERLETQTLEEMEAEERGDDDEETTEEEENQGAPAEAEPEAPTAPAEGE